MRIQRELLAAVRRRKFVAVFHGVTQAQLPHLNVSRIPPINHHPIGPHPAGSYEVWCPREFFADVLDFFMRRRGEETILIHPLSRHEVQDHFGRSMWLGRSMAIDATVLSEDLGHPPLQYPELGYGYSARKRKYLTPVV